MPNYDYKCSECDHKFEMFQKMTDAILETCPMCGGKIKRLIGTGAGTIFKGSGFYQTDYKNAKPDKKAEPAVKTETPPSKSPEVKKSA